MHVHGFNVCVMYVNLVGASVLPLLPGPAPIPGSQLKDLSSHLKKQCVSTSKKYVFVKCSMCQVLFMILLEVWL